MSPPSRRRGLKFVVDQQRYRTDESPPSRRRGLKSIARDLKIINDVVASLAEAWIEIRGKLTA